MTSVIAGVLANADESSSGGSILSLLFLPGLVVLLYFVMIRPQRKRMREQAEQQNRMQQQLQVGSEVITASGIYGTVTGEDGDDVLWLEIDDDVQIRIARAAIQQILGDDDAEDVADSADDTADESDDATTSTD